jgi:hypothetical protein
MTRRPSLLELLVIPVVLAAGTALWLMRADAWDLGGDSPILNYDTAQYAVAARELAWHGALATPYALPVELQRHAEPPWPLATLQPGVVLVEALAYRLVPARGAFASSDRRASFTLVLPFICFLLAGAGLALSTRHVTARYWPGSKPATRAALALTVGLAFVLDPEAQHFAIGGFTEMPFTVGLILATFGLALEIPAGNPLRYGFVLGLAGLFHANMSVLAPVFAAAAAWSGPSGRARRTFAFVLLGWAVPMAPWWFYKWREFGSPGWDLTHFLAWDGIRGQNWFSLYHRPELPVLPHGLEAVRLVAAKILRNLPGLAESMLTGPRGLWLGAVVVWLALARPARPFAAAAAAALAAAALGVLVAAAGIASARSLFPSRAVLEPLGMLALWALVARLPAPGVPLPARRTLLALASVLALGWGAWSTSRGLAEARTGSEERATPSTRTLTAISVALNQKIPVREPIMSNLGPALAWQTLHPVVHLALAPRDVEACRRHLDFRHIVLVFRDARSAWGQWGEIVAREGWAGTLDFGVANETRYLTQDGFVVVWLELAPRGPTLASATP